MIALNLPNLPQEDELQSGILAGLVARHSPHGIHGLGLLLMKVPKQLNITMGMVPGAEPVWQTIPDKVTSWEVENIDADTFTQVSGWSSSVQNLIQSCLETYTQGFTLFTPIMQACGFEETYTKESKYTKSEAYEYMESISRTLTTSTNFGFGLKPGSLTAVFYTVEMPTISFTFGFGWELTTTETTSTSTMASRSTEVTGGGLVDTGRLFIII